ncbi:27119_t:CDS:2 [Dentiscutata erythropus]|uniref:27119_t:CDS:1 n=1 Tax=Dentiscutata erythropus TaxID=1348616 RepID=A0A9N9IFT4_9GLOM|nr:27119_t:CDS:2 [Dentiscutata erythropus]
MSKMDAAFLSRDSWLPKMYVLVVELGWDSECLAMFIVRKSTTECRRLWVWLCGYGDVD